LAIFILLFHKIQNVNYDDFFSSQDKFDLIESVRDIMIQEIMNIDTSEFEGEAIDMDNIAFASKSLNNRFQKSPK
jgi:hypothetical protein